MQAMIKPSESSVITDETISLHKDLTDIILGTDDISAIANMVLDIVVRYTNAGKCSLMLLNTRRELSIIASRGINREISRAFKSRIGEGVAGTVVGQVEPVFVEDIEKDERFRNIRRGYYLTKSFISCPVTGNGKMLGVLNASDRKDFPRFEEHQFDLMRMIACQTAVALENAFLVARFREKTAELEEMNRKLIESDLHKTEFLTRISHELRTPLNSIKGSVYYLNSSERLSDSERREFYSIISKETDKLTSIVENQIDFLAFEDELRTIRKSVISLEEILREVTCSRELSERIDRAGLTLHVIMETGIPEIVGDKSKLCQMFINLIECLLPSLKEGDEIRITVGGNEFVMVGIRLSREIAKETLDTFMQTNHPFQKTGSEEGVKMYLARKTADSHGWEMKMDNTGDAFMISIEIPKSRRQKIETAVGKSIDLFLEFIAEMMGLSTCSIMLRDEASGEMKIQSALGLDKNIVRSTRIRPGDQISGWVALEGKPVLVENIESDERFARKNIPQYNTKSLISVPLRLNDRVLGVLNLNNKKTAEPFTQQDLSIAAALGARLTNLMEKLKDDEGWENGFREFTASFDKLLTAGRKYNKKGSLFRNLTRRIMDAMESADEEKELALYVSMVYDLGLMLMDEEVLNKTKLEPSEFASLKVHPFTTVELLSGIESSPEVKQAILHHHEKYDGTGYPDALSGDSIPLVSRVIAVVDAYCAMVSKRPYRNEMSGSEALEVIRNSSGTCYDPKVVKALEQALMQI